MFLWWSRSFFLSILLSRLASLYLTLAVVDRMVTRFPGLGSENVAHPQASVLVRAAHPSQ